MGRLFIVALFFPLWVWAGTPQSVLVLTLDGAIGPASADYVQRGLERARDDGAALVVLAIDTPGGLDTSMRKIIKNILASPVPVAGFVYPDGARAASAGTYILYASHIAAMAPVSNLGAATPVQIGAMPSPPEKPAEGEDKGTPKPDQRAKSGAKDTLAEKQINDAAAYIRSLARLRGRNADWAEKAVRQAVSLSAHEALGLRVVDVVADSVSDLLRQIDGRRVNVGGNRQTLHTKDAAIVDYAPDWRHKLLATFTDPNVAYILMLIGMWGLFFEFSNPGFVLPGVVGAICLIVALFAFQLLPVNYAGLGLIALGLAFLIAEVFLAGSGILGIGGVIAFAIGSVLLLDSDVPGFDIAWPLIITFSTLNALFIVFVLGMAIKARTRPVVTGDAHMIGAVGEVIEDFEGEGWALIRGENWKAHSDTPLRRGQRVKVTGLDGLVVNVVSM
ncbi:MAG: NfeD family protein [Burkholderiales bacterium]